MKNKRILIINCWGGNRGDEAQINSLYRLIKKINKSDFVIANAYLSARGNWCDFFAPVIRRPSRTHTRQSFSKAKLLQRGLQPCKDHRENRKWSMTVVAAWIETSGSTSGSSTSPLPHQTIFEMHDQTSHTVYYTCMKCACKITASNTNVQQSSTQPAAAPER